MILAGTKKFIAAAFDSEQELERVVQTNSEYIFGPDSIYLPKSLVRTSDGFGTIPDGFVVNLASRIWFIVEAELSVHSVWNHIAPQVAKQIIAASQPSSRRMLTEVLIGRIKENLALKDRFEELGVSEIDIRRVISEIFEKPPRVGIPIDRVSDDLREWALTVRVEVKLWVIRKLVEFGTQKTFFTRSPEEYRPVLDTSPESESTPSGLHTYDVTIADLISSGLLSAGDKLFMVYRPRGGERRQYEALVTAEGTIEVLGKSFTAPSYAALLGIQDAGSDRNTVNGWVTWKKVEGKTLAELRDHLVSNAAVGP